MSKADTIMNENRSMERELAIRYSIIRHQALERSEVWVKNK